MLRHDPGAGHPERIARLTTLQDVAKHPDLVARLAPVAAPRASKEALCRAHTPAYVDQVLAHADLREPLRLDEDTVLGPGSVEAALRAAGAVVCGVDRVMTDRNPAAFCAVRPPGHHAQTARAMGFCVFNNVVVGAKHALEAHGVARLAVIDFDVHHGNGTEDILRHDQRTVLCSSFQHPLWPGSGATPLAENMWPVPVPPGTAGPAWRTMVEEAWFDRLEVFAPELILISAGFDAHEADPLAQLRLTADDVGWITRKLRAIAARHAQGRIVSVLEGGYDLKALRDSAVAHCRALAE